MPRRTRPKETTRSEHWLRVAVNDRTAALNSLINDAFSWGANERISWLSPAKHDDYAEYYDEAFLERLGVRDLAVPLRKFWPPSGPRWDGLACTQSGKLILMEAKAYIEEAVDYRTNARPKSLKRIRAALSETKKAFGATADAPWEAPFYQYANRLAHLYFLKQKNGLDAYLLFLYFADAPDVPQPCSEAEWSGAIRITEKCLGLGQHPFRENIATVIWSVPEMVTA